MNRARPRTVLDALNEINRIGAHAVRLNGEGALLGPQFRAVRACLQAASRVKSAAISAAAMAEELQSNAWARQWRAKKPPRQRDQLVHELPLWYLGIIVKGLRRAMELDGEDAAATWACDESEWSVITSTMVLAKDAILADSLEARVEASRRMRDARAEKKKAAGPAVEPAPMAHVIPLHA